MRRFIAQTQLALPSMLLMAWMCIFTTPATAQTGNDSKAKRGTTLAERGITFVGLGELIGQYNTTGGIETGGALNFRIVGEANFKLEPLAGLKGSEIMISGALNYGEDINDKVGAIISLDQFRGDELRLYELYWSQFWADEQVNLKFGRLGMGPFEWGHTAYNNDFLSNAYQAASGGFYVNQPVVQFSWPIATWGARVLIEPKDEDYSVRLGVYNGWPRDLGADDNGIDFSFNLEESTFLIGEFNWKLNQDPEDQGLPGNYKIGFMQDTGPFDRFDDPGATKRGNSGYYIIVDQMVRREKVPGDLPDDHPANWKVGFHPSHPQPTDQGLYVWGGFIANPDKAINIAPYWVTGGLSYKGLFPGRDADRTGIGSYYAFFSSDTPLDYEFHTELYHHLQFTPKVNLSLDIQYIVNPGGLGTPNALVVGAWLHFVLG